VVVFAVWEPILPTDWGQPSTWVLARLSDPRARQFWDVDHFVARQMAADARKPQPVARCCEQSGILWDLVAVYPKAALWTNALPPAVFVDGPVVDIESPLHRKLLELLSD
jgi:hypothetical protein